MTSNGQGNSDGHEWRLEKYEPDVMVVQECGNLTGRDEGTPMFPVQAPDVGPYRCFYGQWSRHDAGGIWRCSLAMFYTQSGGPSVMGSLGGTKRRVMKKNVNGFLVCEIHAGGIDYIGEVLEAAHSAGKFARGFVVAGDFNQSPTTIAELPIVKSNNMHVIHTRKGEATRPASGRRLDFADSSQEGVATLGVDHGGSNNRHVVIDLY